MTITYYKGCDIACITEYTSVGNVLSVQDGEGKPIRASVTVGDSTYLVKGSTRVNNSSLEGRVLLDLGGRTYSCGNILAVGDAKAAVLNVNQTHVLALAAALDQAIRTIEQHEKRIKDLETSAYGVDIMNLK